MFKIIKKIQFSIIRILEKYPQFNLFILNNIIYFKFFLPHEKDYYGIKLIFKETKNLNAFLDVGANVGTSTLGFIRMGFENRIYLFEPNYFLCKKYLRKIEKKYRNIFVYNYFNYTLEGYTRFKPPVVDPFNSCPFKV